MLCHQCGSPVDANAGSCQNCGAELRSTRKLKLTESRGLRISQQLRAIRIDQQIFPPGEEVATRFVLGEMIGKGPLGEVYRARDKAIDTEVAVKIFAQELLSSPRDEEHFVRATRAGRRLTQPNAVRLHNSGVHKDHPWVSMQLLEGLSLRKVLDLRREKGEVFELSEVEPVAQQVAAALGAQEFPHGVLKPENIVFLPDLVKVTDSFVLNAFSAKTLIPRLRDSAYFAPELLTPETAPTPRADVYSMGVIIGEMLFGPDYTPGNANAGAVDALIKRATAFDPDERYATVSALAEELTTVIATGALLGVPSKQAPPAPPPGPAPSDVVAIPQLDKVSEPDDLATVEYNRDLDAKLQDSILTREVSREDQVATDALTREVDRGAKSPTVTAATPKPKKSRPVTTTTQAPAPRPTKDGNGGMIVLLVMVVVVLVAIIALTRGGGDGPEEIGQPTKVAAKTDAKSAEPKTAEPAKTSTEPSTESNAATTDTTATSTQVAAATQEAGTQEPATQEPATAQPTTPEPAVEPTPATPPAESTSVAAVTPKPEPAPTPTPAAAAPKTTSTSSTPKTEPRPSEPKTAPATTAKTSQPAAAAAGTECPAGMGLVKSSSGNYCIDRYEHPGGNTKPQVNVTWFQATKSCESKGKRLCELAEWRNACGARYPYGSTHDADKCNTADEDGFERSLAATGSFKECRSRASGAYDMVGNAHEWVAEQRIAGGGFESGEDVASCRYSSPKAPSSSAGYIGFRCCADPQ